MKDCTSGYFCLCAALLTASFTLFLPTSHAALGGERHSTTSVTLPAVPAKSPAVTQPLAPVVKSPGMAQPGMKTPFAPQRKSPIEQLLGLGGEDSADAASTDILPFITPPSPSAPVGGPAPSLPGTTPEKLIDESRLRQGIVRVEIYPATLMVLSAPYTGTITSISVRDGDSVPQGQAVAFFDVHEVEQRLAAAKTAEQKAARRLALADAEQRGGPERRERDEYAAEHAATAAELRLAQEMLSRSAVTAPFPARVTEIKVKAGQRVQQGDPILEIAETGQLEIICMAPSSWLRLIKPGHRFWVYLDETAQRYEAEVVRIGGKVDPATRSVRVYSRFVSPPADLLPGMSGSASLIPVQQEQ